MADTLNAARVRVPCSTSNLGSGYDTIGLALNRYLEATFEPGPTGLSILRGGSLAAAGYDDGDDLVALSFAKALRSMGYEVGGTLHLTSDIPIGKGLGSSAAAILAGFDLALAVSGQGRDDARVFKAAYEHEGHGDNAAPCLYGGLRAVLPGAAGPLPIELELSPNLGFAYAAPAAAMETKVSRNALPERVGQRAADFTEALELGRAEDCVGHGVTTSLSAAKVYSLHLCCRKGRSPGHSPWSPAASRLGAPRP